MCSSSALAASTAAAPTSANNSQRQQQQLHQQQQQHHQRRRLRQRLCQQHRQQQKPCSYATNPAEVEVETAALEGYARHRLRAQSQQRQQQQAKRQRCNISVPSLVNVWHVVLLLVMLGAANSHSDRLPTDTEVMAATATAPPQTDRASAQPGSKTFSPNGSADLGLDDSALQTAQRTTNHSFRSYSIVDGSAGASFDEQLLLMAAASSASEAQPIFDFGLTRNITGRTGQTEALIKCRVDLLNDKSVSWIRKRDLHILTVGTATYTSDKRFQVSESRDAREWTLHVKAPQTRDSGIYECQVNTEPKISMAFQLNIIENSPDSRAIISGPADLHFKVGSAIILSCVVQQPSMRDIGPIYWYRGEHMITTLFDVERETAAAAGSLPDGHDDASNAIAASSADAAPDFAARIAIETQLGDTLKSRLRIANAQTTDTGNYTCQPTTASSASVMVHVINDENPAAMQKSDAVALRARCTRCDSFAAIICCQPMLPVLPLLLLLAAAECRAGLRRTTSAIVNAAAVLVASGFCVAVRLISIDIINDSITSAVIMFMMMVPVVAVPLIPASSR